MLVEVFFLPWLSFFVCLLRLWLLLLLLLLTYW